MSNGNIHPSEDYKRESGDGRYFTVEYEVFPGISIIYYTSHIQKGDLRVNDKIKNGVFEIFHCREGRMECSVGTDYCYISPGDLFIVKDESLTSSLSFPLRHYHGITIRIDTKAAPKCLSCFLRDVAVQPQAIKERFCENRPYFIARSNPSFEHIFSELYAVPSEIRQGYSKIKVLELMLFLSVFDTEEAMESRIVSPAQANFAKEIAAYMTENMYEKLTLEHLTGKFHTSATAIKSAFKAVYGVSFYVYIKTQKMESAAYMLEYTDKTVLDIANEHGYANSGKFAVAFRSVKGIAPQEYRMQNYKLK